MDYEAYLSKAIVIKKYLIHNRFVCYYFLNLYFKTKCSYILTLNKI